MTVAALAAAQEGENTETPVFAEEVAVRVIEVAVVVTDRDDNPVLGLRQQDFEIFEDGEPVEITNFYAVEAGRRREPDAEGLEAGEGADAAAGAVAAPADAGTYLVILFDGTTLAPSSRQRLVKKLGEELPRLAAASAGTMIVNLDRRIHVESSFTRDLELLQTALDRLATTAVAPSSRSSRSFLLREIEAGTDPREAGFASSAREAELIMARAKQDGSSILSSIRSEAGNVFHDIQRANDQVKAFVSSLAGLPGRKAVLFVSDGFELRPSEVLYRIWWDTYSTIAAELGVGTLEGEISRNEATFSIDRMIAHASANSVTFYTVDAGGLDMSAFSAEVGRVSTSSALLEQQQQQVGALQHLAVATGGLSILYSQNVTPFIDDMTRGFETFYSLGYSARQAGDGSRRRIEVELKRPGLRLRYATGYLDKSAEELMNERTLASLYLDVADNPLDVRVELGQPERADKDQYLLPVVVKVPIAKLTLVPEQDRHLARLSLVFAALDDRGTSSPARTELPLAIPNEQLLTALGQSAAYEAKLRVREGEQKLAVGVRDEIGRLTSTVNLVATVGRTSGGGR